MHPACTQPRPGGIKIELYSQPENMYEYYLHVVAIMAPPVAFLRLQQASIRISKASRYRQRVAFRKLACRIESCKFKLYTTTDGRTNDGLFVIVNCDTVDYHMFRFKERHGMQCTYSRTANMFRTIYMLNHNRLNLSREYMSRFSCGSTKTYRKIDRSDYTTYDRPETDFQPTRFKIDRKY